MTTNESFDEIRPVLETAKNKDIKIEIDYIIHTSVNYLDITITNENGYLTTRVYHKPTAEPYYLPYTSDHPHKYQRNILYSALIRAARLCSNVHDFNLERLRIDISLLLSQYPPKFITNQFLRFFQMNNAMPVFTELNQDVYQRSHKELINRITEKEKQLNDQTKDPVKYPIALETKKKNWDRTIMCPKFVYERGPFARFSNELHSWWRKHYQYSGSPVNRVQIKFKPKINRTLP